MILVLDLDRTLNLLYPPWIRSIRDLVPPALASRGSYEMWEWIAAHVVENNYPVHEAAVPVIRTLSAQASRVIVNTGRPEKARCATEGWLHNYFKVDQLLMRAEGDFRRTVEIKREHLIMDILPSCPGEVIYAFDDNREAVRMYQDNGAIALVAPECWIAAASVATSQYDLLKLLHDLHEAAQASVNRACMTVSGN
ncbi:MAG: hypothetical protein JO189_32435 [Deltaproteobacteria bacterium]|nr:hypothetical protein [Deltaproteobacteria bacterium]